MCLKPIRSENLSPTLGLHVYAAHTGGAYNAGHRNTQTGESLASEGFWLYDETRGMNLAMRAESERAAFVKALTYYQLRLATVESELQALTDKVDSFVAQFKDGEEN